MPIATFELKPLIEIIEITKALPNTPTTDDLFDESCWPDGRILNEEGLSKNQAPDAFWPDASRIDTSKLKDSFSLVGDQGVYLLPNKKHEGSAKSNNYLVYAKGCNPETDEDYYENKRAIFGGDDGAIRIPFKWILVAQQNNNTHLKIKLGPNSVELVSEFRGNKPNKLKAGMAFSLGKGKFTLIGPSTIRGSWYAKDVNDKKVYRITAKQLNQATFD